MSDYADPKRAMARKALIQSLRSATGKRLMQHDKSQTAPISPTIEKRKGDVPAERHRAWLRRAVRRDK